jgi:Ni/Co efflux regulator RcnB
MKKLHLLALFMLLSTSIGIVEADSSNDSSKKSAKAKAMRAHKAKKAAADADNDADKRDGDHKKAAIEKRMQENGFEKGDVKAKLAAKKAVHEKGSMKDKFAAEKDDVAIQSNRRGK